MGAEPSYPSPGELAPLHTRRAIFAVGGMFVLNGVLIGGYGGVLPSLQLRLDLTSTQISVLLLASGLAAIAAMQIGGRVSDAIGPRPVVLTGLPIMASGACVLALAPTFVFAILGSALLGLGGGSMDVSMNALGVQIERARAQIEGGKGGSILSTLHALWSVGNFGGAGLVLAVGSIFHLHHAAVIDPVLFSVAAIGIAGWMVLFRVAPRGGRVHERQSKGSGVPRAAYLLGAIAFASGLAEGTAADWSSIHVTEVAHVDPVIGSLGLVAVSAFMVTVRFLGDRLVDRYGRRAVVRFGGGCAAVGYLAVASLHPLPLLVVGWSIVGFGVGLLAPQVYGAAGHLGGGRALAAVVTFGYAGFLSGPAIIGVAARRVGIQATMALPAVLSLAVVAFAGTMPKKAKPAIDL